jgi:hypothetical protein
MQKFLGMGLWVFGVGCFAMSAGAQSSPPWPVEKNLKVGFSKVDITPYDIGRRLDPDQVESESQNNPYASGCSGNQCYRDYRYLIEGPRTHAVFERPAFQSAFGPIFIGGYAPYYPIPFYHNRWAQGIHDPIWARAVAIEGEDGKTVILMSTDLPGLTWKHINPVRREIEKVFHIPMSNIIITSTHNHAGPDAAGYWTSTLPGHLYEYTHALRAWMLDAAVQAIRSMEPAKVRTITTTHIACYDPNTREFKKDPDCRLPPTTTDHADSSGAPYDWEIIQGDKRDPKVYNHMISIQHFTRAKTGETIGTFINWHNHPDTLGGDNKFISSDFPHYLRQYVEERLGGIAAYFSGTVGCQIGPGSPVPAWSHDEKPLYQEGVTDIHGKPVRAFTPDNPWERIRSIGYEIGNEVVEAVKNAKEPELDSLAITVKTEPIDIAPNNILHVVGSGPVWRFDVEDEDTMHWYLPRCAGRFGCVRSDVSLLQLGNLSVITAPGEIDPAYVYGRKASHGAYASEHRGKDWDFPAMEGVRPLLKGPHIAVLGQANNYLSYLLPLSDNVGALNFKQAPHYEEFVTVNKHFGNDVGNKWMQMLGSPHRYSDRKIYPGGSR